MNKNVFVLAALGAAASAHADVDVAAGFKIYGVLDQAYMRQSVASANSTPKLYSNTGFFAAAATSRVGFKGDRVLTETMKGVIQFEQELTPDESTLMPSKNRMAFVGLDHKEYGAMRLGTLETPAYVLFTTDVNGRVEYKPQLWRFLAASATQDRANNAVKLTSPKFGPVTVDFMRGYSEVNAGGITPPSNDFKSWGLNYQEGQLSAKAVWDSLTNTAMSYALPGEPNAGLITYATDKPNGVTQNKTNMIASSTSKPLQRAFVSVTYDMAATKLNYIFAGAYTENKGQVLTNTIGIRVPMDKIALAISMGFGTYTNAAGNNGTATVAGKLSDTTLGAYYSFDKATSVYLLTSLGRNRPSVSTTAAQNGSTVGFTSDVNGETKTTAMGLRYNY